VEKNDQKSPHHVELRICLQKEIEAFLEIGVIQGTYEKGEERQSCEN
jgi:hypothetical protein